MARGFQGSDPDEKHITDLVGRLRNPRKRIPHENVVPFYGVNQAIRLSYLWAQNQDIQRHLKANTGTSCPNLVMSVLHFGDKRSDGDPHFTVILGH